MTHVPEIEVARTSGKLKGKLPVFATEAFLASKSPDYGWFVSEDLALPFVIDRTLCFSRMIFTSEPIYVRDSVSPQREIQFLNEVLRLCSLRGGPLAVDSVSSSQANVVSRVVPDGSDYISWGSYVVDLTSTEEAIFANFHSKHRNVIRKASATGVKISTTGDTRLIYSNLQHTMRRQHVLFYPSQSYLDRLQRNLQNNITFYVATHEGTLQGTAVIAHNDLGAFYYYGGSVTAPTTGSLNLMHYEIMQDLKRKGVPVYDLMGARLDASNNAKIEGIQRFKSRFASGVRVGYRFRKIIRPTKHKIFLAAVKTYFTLRHSSYAGDVIDECPANARVGPASVAEVAIVQPSAFRS
jgi:hypothetical protein